LAGTNRSALDDDVLTAAMMPAVILSHPQMGENIGAAARAMKNCGLHDLRLVKPRDGWPNPAAEAMASGGADILTAAKVFETTPEAAGDITLLIATTARKRGMAQTVMTPRQAANAIISHHQAGGRAGMLFGAERAGLDNDEAALANILVTVPLNPAFSSLNLAQAVLLMGWECRMAGLAVSQEQGETASEEDDKASLEDREYFYAMLEDSIAKGGFFASPDMRPVIMRNIKAMFNKAPLSRQDIRTLHGIVKAIARSGKT
jgi:tRNA/rRNA methyltransferase